MDNLLTQIDSIKQKITDQEYRELMSSLMTVNRENQNIRQEHTGYEVILGVIENNKGDCSHAKPEYRLQKEIVRPSFIAYPTDKLNELVEKTERDGLLTWFKPVHLQNNRLTIFDCIDIEAEQYANYIRYNEMSNYDSSDDDHLVATYQKYTLLAVRKI